jgi:diacylglycerol kinase family enzyme
MPAENESPLVLFVNAAAGSGAADELIELWKDRVPLERQGPVFAAREKSECNSELDRAVAYCADSEAVLIVAGGDGTVNSAIEKAASKKITIGVIPRGTFNYFARSHGIPEDAGEAIDLLLTAQPVTIPLAYVNNRPFIVSVSIGAHPTVIAEREQHMRHFGRSRLGAWISGIWTVLRARHIIRVMLRTKQWRRQIITPLLLINFSPAQLLGLDSRFEYQPGRLAVLRLKKDSYRGITLFILRALNHRVLDEGSLQCQYVDELTIEAPRKSVQVALDGELLRLKSPMVFHVEKEGVSCLLKGDSR